MSELDFNQGLLPFWKPTSVDQKVKMANDIVVAKVDDMSAVQLKLIRLMFSRLSDFPDYEQYYNLPRCEFTVKEIKSLMELKGESIYTWLKDQLVDLQKKSVILETVNSKGKKGFSTYQWVTDSHCKDGIVQLQFNPALYRWLSQLKGHFTMYAVKNVLQLTCSNTIRLYELLKMNQFRGTFTISLEEFKDIMGLPKNRLYANIRQSVLLPAQNEINSYTDITFEFETGKTSRKVDKLLFTVGENSTCHKINIKSLFNQQGLKPSAKDLERFRGECTKHNLSDEQIEKVIRALADRQRKGMVQKPMAVFFTDPEGVINGILDGTFYTASEKKKKNPAADSEYQTYIPPELMHLMDKEKKSAV